MRSGEDDGRLPALLSHATASLRATPTIADRLHSGEGLRPTLQKFVAAIALNKGDEIGGNLSFHSLWYPIVPRISDNHFAWARLIASCGDDHVFRYAFYRSLYQAPPRSRVRLSPAPESQVEDKGDETSHNGPAKDKALM